VIAQLTDADYAAVRDYLALTAGLVFDENRRGGLAVVVADRLRASGSTGVPAYLAGLHGDEGHAERMRLLDGVTVQETHFFRNSPQMDALRQRVLPDLMRRAAKRDRPLTIWSAGCSTGEEAYTLAMLILELSANGAAGPGAAPARIVATDISTEAVLAARAATYRGRTLATMPPGARDRWLEPRSGGAWAVRNEVRRLVDVRVHNLVADPPPFAPGEVDLVVCRNVTIYFSRETTRALIGNFYDVIAPGGYLLLGHSETLWQVSDAFTLAPMGEAFVYRRSADVRSGRASQAQLGKRSKAAPRAGSTAAPVRRLAQGEVARRRTPADDLSAARAALASGDYAEAARVAEAATAADSLNAEGYVVLGHARSTLGLDSQAIGPLRKAIYLDPTAGHAHFLLAGALARVGQHAAAAVSYRAAARALSSVPLPVLDSYLGGRSVTDLVELCQRLARASAELATGGTVDSATARSAS
jgi:chemotaxis protein methyltransferase CheR